MRNVQPASVEYTISDQQRMRGAKRYFRWQHSMAESHLGRRIIEVGCGVGNFTQFLLDREMVVAVDVEPACIDESRRRFSGSSNLLISQLDVSDDRFRELAVHRPDSIACLNVLEHVEDDYGALCNMCSVLSPNGRIVLIVPAFESLYGPIDASLGHFRRYSKISLSTLASKAALRPVQLRYTNSVGFFGWWLNARIFKREHQSKFQITVFDRAVVPVLRRLEERIEPPFGQSLFAVLMKQERTHREGGEDGR